jgi:hypothetical protein
MQDAGYRAGRMLWVTFAPLPLQRVAARPTNDNAEHEQIRPPVALDECGDAEREHCGIELQIGQRAELRRGRPALSRGGYRPSTASALTRP